MVKLPTVSSLRRFEACFNVNYGVGAVSELLLNAAVKRVYPEYNFYADGGWLSSYNPVIPATTTPAGEPAPQRLWNHNNCGYIETSTGGEYIALVYFASFTSVTSTYGTPGALAVFPNYIKISTID
ncbi:hypothetical protein [Rhizobacter sp. Root404]|uniref:hypothetical protein n=1 Tax=Rhizobacter sp. Root404 TaxID=1736528 RepID=UPI001F228513|nr:hypothetical protein [Rhizobacter sp. Root404]